MGVVYKAQDLKLDRSVALKFLPHSLTTDADAKQRFIHEAKTTSALQHNNICVVHDIDRSEDGQMFISMEYLKGEPLRHSYQLDPENAAAQFFYAWSLMCAGKLDEAFSIVDRSEQAAPESVFTKFALLLKYGLLKDKEKAFRKMTPDFQKTCRRDHQWSYFVAIPFALIDAGEDCLDWLENAVNKGFINYPELVRNPYLDNVRGKEQFKKLMEGVKYEWEHFEV